MNSVFVSHSSIDRDLASEFVDTIVTLGSGVPRDKIFFSSGSGTGVPSGEDLSAYVRRAAQDATLTIAIITPQFLQSAYCLAEMGAAWSRTGALFPLLHPGVDRAALNGVLNGVVVRTLDDTNALDELHDRLQQLAIGTSNDTGTWIRHRKRWLDSVLNMLQPYLSPAGGSVDVEAIPSNGNSMYLPSLAVNHRWGQLFDSFVDAALYVKDDRLARQDIIEHVHAGTLIPSRYHYASDSGADLWLRLCAEPTYRHHTRTTEFWAGRHGRELAKRIHEEANSDTLDHISLGPGDGRKDGDLASHWLAKGVNLFYYPYDISLPLASRAVQHMKSRVSDGSTRNLNIKAVLADFKHFPTMRQVFRHRASPNVVMLLGTLGNFDRELAFLRELRDTLDFADLIVLEVRLRSADDSEELISEVSLRHDFGPLEYYLGVPFDRSLMNVVSREGISAIPNTQTVMVTRQNLPLNGEVIPEVRLQYVHLYEPNSFLEAVEETGFELIYDFVDNTRTFLECLLRRKH